MQGIWETETGHLLECADLICLEGERWPPSFLGVELAPNGRRFMEYSELGYGLHDILNGNTSLSVVVNNPDSKNRKTVGRISFAKNDDRIAIGYQEGAIEIENGLPLFRLGTYDWENPQRVLDLEFSPQGRIIAWIRGDGFKVWELGILGGKLLISENLQSAKLLAFNHNDTLLLIADEDKVHIWDLEEKRRITALSTPGISSLTLTTDDRLLIWGDRDGAIHLWGVSSD